MPDTNAHYRPIASTDFEGFLCGKTAKKSKICKPSK